MFYNINGFQTLTRFESSAIKNVQLKPNFFNRLHKNCFSKKIQNSQALGKLF